MTRNIQATDAQGNKVNKTIQINGVDPTSSGGGGAFEDGDGDGIYTLPNTGDGIDVASVNADDLDINLGARVSGSANQTVSSATETKINFDVVPSGGWDIGGDYDTANMHFVAPVGGKYDVSGSVHTGGFSGTTTVQMKIAVNGTIDTRHDINGGESFFDVDGTVDVAAGDTIDIRIHHDEGADVTVNPDVPKLDNAVYQLKG